MLVGAVARGLRRAGETAQRERARFGLHGQACGRKFLAKDCRNAFADSVRAVVGADASVVLQEERDVGPRERNAMEHTLAMAELGGLGAQELAPGGRIEIQVCHRDRRPGLARRRFDRPVHRPFGIQGIGVRRSTVTRSQRHAGNRCDRGQRLATEPERPDGLQVLQGPYLARCVARKGKLEILACDAAAVVLNLDARDTASVEQDLHFGCAGVEAVLEQFLEDGGGPLDDFTGRDLADQKVG